MLTLPDAWAWDFWTVDDRGPNDTFVGAVSDPMPVIMTADGLRLA